MYQLAVLLMCTAASVSMLVVAIAYAYKMITGSSGAKLVPKHVPVVIEDDTHPLDRRIAEVNARFAKQLVDPKTGPVWPAYGSVPPVPPVRPMGPGRKQE